MKHDFARNHFELLGLPVSFAVDPAALERAYRDLQGRVHPGPVVRAAGLHGPPNHVAISNRGAKAPPLHGWNEQNR